MLVTRDVSSVQSIAGNGAGGQSTGEAVFLLGLHFGPSVSGPLALPVLSWRISACCFPQDVKLIPMGKRRVSCLQPSATFSPTQMIPALLASTHSALSVWEDLSSLRSSLSFLFPLIHCHFLESQIRHHLLQEDILPCIRDCFGCPFVCSYHPLYLPQL